MTWNRRGGRKVIIAPDGSDAWAPANPRPDETLIRALTRVHRWNRLIGDGTYRSAAEIAEAEGVTELHQPDSPADPGGAGYEEAIFEGRQRKGMTVQDLTRAVPSAWTEQRNLIGIPHP